LTRGGEKMRKNGGSNSAGMFDQYRDACAVKDNQCWLKADYEHAVKRDALFHREFCLGQNKSRYKPDADEV
jgi:hypothetical protein